MPWIVEPALSALISAWSVTMAAVSVLSAALAVAPYWDQVVFFPALQDALASGF